MGIKPDIKTFREVLRKCGGNISKTAASFKVTRLTIYNWAKSDVEFKNAIADERGLLVDECLVSARVLALGIPDYEEVEVVDPNTGQTRTERQMVGWRERPDGHMLRYLLSTLGRKDGFGEQEEDNDAPDIPQNIRRGVDVKEWLKREMEDRADGMDA